MPDLLAALIAFVAEHRRCGELDGGLEAGTVWLGCTCGAELVCRTESAAEAAGPDRDQTGSRRGG